MLKGTLVIMQGNCNKDLKGIYHDFIPTTDTQKALDYVAGNGDIIGTLEWKVDIDELDQIEKNLMLQRLSYLQ